jgi:hypothetical protein
VTESPTPGLETPCALPERARPPVDWEFFAVLYYI